MSHLPAFAPVRQHLSTDHIADVDGHVRGQLAACDLQARIKPGMRVAIGLGSRGVSCIRDVVTPLVETLLAWGALPFLVPAMGSHGGATLTKMVRQ